MSHYWRDPDTNSVFQYRGEPDNNEVVVIPLADWQRLMENWENVSTTVLEDAALDSAEEIDAIIKKVSE
jgi:hypothetical protein